MLLLIKTKSIINFLRIKDVKKHRLGFNNYLV